MLIFNCDKCYQEIDSAGAILWSPPNAEGKCDKFHICTDCYKGLRAWVGTTYLDKQKELEQNE